MSEPNIHLSDAARAYAEAKAREAGQASADEVVEAIVQKAIRREASRKRLEELLIEGLESGPGTPVTPEYWDRLRKRIRARQPTRRGSST